MSSWAAAMAIFSLFAGYAIMRGIGAPRKISVALGVVCAAVNGFIVAPNAKEHSALILTVFGLMFIVSALTLARGAWRRRKRQ